MDEQRAVEALTRVIGDLGHRWDVREATGRPPARRSGATAAALAADESVDSLLAVARLVHQDRRQRAVDVAWTSPERMDETRLALRTAIADTGLEVTAWLWRPQSAGQPVTDSGRLLGYEVRLSPRSRAQPDQPARGQSDG